MVQLPVRAVDARLAETLLAPLIAHYPVAGLFLEARRRLGLRFDGDKPSPPKLEHARGLELRGVNQDRSAAAWTTDWRRTGLRGLLRALTPDVASVALQGSSPPEAERLEPAPWCEAFGSLARALPTRAHPRLSLTVVHRCRATFSAPGSGVCWSRRFAHLELTLARSDGSLCRRCLWLPAARPEDLAESGLLERAHRLLAQGLPRVGGVRGEVPVVVSGSGGAVFFHELVGHGLEADHVLQGDSPFVGLAYGTQVGPEELIISDSPAPEDGCGGIVVDDEGERALPAPLIERGRLVGLLHDRVTAAMVDRQPTGNGRREDFRFPPAPRMRNLVVAPGSVEPEALLSGIRTGLYIEQAGLGQVDLNRGRFHLQVLEARRITRGRLGEPLRDLQVQGDVRTALGAIEGIGCDQVRFPEPLFCGKRGVVVTGYRGPTVRLGRLEVIS